MTTHEPQSVPSQYVDLKTEGGLLIYDKEYPTAWIQSSTAVNLAAML